MITFEINFPAGFRFCSSNFHGASAITILFLSEKTKTTIFWWEKDGRKRAGYNHFQWVTVGNMAQLR